MLSRLVPAAGAIALAGVAVCAAAAWPEGSTLVPRNTGQPSGEMRWAWIFLAAEAAAFAAYALAVLLARRLGTQVAVAATIGVLIQLTPLAAPLLLSTDAWTYWDYGRIAAFEGGNPYRDTPSDFPGDPAYPYVGESWRDTTSVYGPAFTLASEPIARAASASADAAAWIYKTLAALGMVAAAALAARLSRRPALAWLLVGWNPLLALHFGGGGHNDVWMIVLVLGALALGASARAQTAGVAWVAAIFVKWLPLLFLPLRALEARAQNRTVGHAGFALAAIAAAGLATWRYGLSWLGAIGPLAQNADRQTSYALPQRLEQLGLPEALTLLLAGAVFLVFYVRLLRQAARGRARLGLAACLFLLTTPYLAAWYVVWALPLAAAEDDDVAQWLSLALSAYLLPQAIPL